MGSERDADTAEAGTDDALVERRHLRRVVGLPEHVAPQEHLDTELLRLDLVDRLEGRAVEAEGRGVQHVPEVDALGDRGAAGEHDVLADVTVDHRIRPVHALPLVAGGATLVDAEAAGQPHPTVEEGTGETDEADRSGLAHVPAQEPDVQPAGLRLPGGEARERLGLRLLRGRQLVETGLVGLLGRERVGLLLGELVEPLLLVAALHLDALVAGGRGEVGARTHFDFDGLGDERAALDGLHAVGAGLRRDDDLVVVILRRRRLDADDGEAGDRDDGRAQELAELEHDVAPHERVVRPSPEWRTDIGNHSGIEQLSLIPCISTTIGDEESFFVLDIFNIPY